jgi:cell division protease FtsH
MCRTIDTHEDIAQFGAATLAGCMEDERGEVAKVRQSVSAFLGDGPTIDLPLSIPLHYSDLMAWALDRQRRMGGWKVAHISGRSSAKATYVHVSVAPGRYDQLFYDGVMLLQRGDVRLAVYLVAEQLLPSTVLVCAAPRHQREGAAFLRGIEKRVREKKLYRGQKFEFAGRIRFLELAPRSWDEVALPPQTKEMIIAHTTRFLERAGDLEPFGVSPRRGLLLTGKPGTGKTLICKVLMNTSPGISCIAAHSAAMLEPRYIDDLFHIAADLSPSIVFLEDIDLVGQGRIRSYHRNADALARLLYALDGIQDCKNVVTVATTNWVEILDEALKDRPSRFDRIVYVNPPDARERRTFLRSLAARIPMPAELVERLVERTAGLTPAQIQEVVHSAAIEVPVSPDAPDFWKQAFATPTMEDTLAQMKGTSAGIGFVVR